MSTSALNLRVNATRIATMESKVCTTSKQLMGWTLGLIHIEQGDNYNKFIAAVLRKGGAEGWVQVELDQRYKTLPNVAWVQCEQAIFQDRNEKVDFLISCRGGSTACVELKVESLFQSADLGRSTMPHRQWTLVSSDITKLTLGRSAAYAQAPAYVVAILSSPEAIAGLDTWLRSSGLAYLREVYPTDHDGVQYPVTVYVIIITGD